MLVGAGLIPAIIALVKYKKAIKLYTENTENYSNKSFEYLKIGRITSIIGIVISALLFLMLFFIVGFFILTSI